MDDQANLMLRRWEDRAELPLLAASLLFLAGYAVSVLAHGDPILQDIALAVIALSWLCFGVDYLVRRQLSGLGLWRFARTHWLDTLVLLLPLLRPLRVVKVYTAVQRRRDQPRYSLYARAITYAGLSAVLLGFSGALAVYQQERGAPGASIRTFGDALWWVCETLTTVGYGDVVPVTAGGRGIAVLLMVCGLALLGAVTGSFSSWLLAVFAREDEKRQQGRTGGEDGSGGPGK
ncbi:ion transporter [Streptomyces venezuelae]|uniref:Ion transporter n=1 Tax=Streptomyces venezuelae TaxID=54571 RepID=A0A5P2DAC3_STRVZ|nr:potassium channel family protein [Streptomyces venezuelae]QES51018.1 ion transporter [Streptomyces venezuelae]